jgi:hypothetical protein
MSSSRFLLSGVSFLVLGGAVVLACSGDAPTTYGPPSGLQGKSPAEAFTNNGDDDGGGGGNGGGNGNGNGGGNGGGGDAGCGGAGPIDGGACAVKWSTDIYPKMTAGGAWKCADTNCHGGNATPPIISGTSASAAYTALVNYGLIADTTKHYFNPCSTDPAQSAFVCNTTTPSTCGALGMPSLATPPGAAAPTPTELTQIATWVGCGAPEN